MATSTRFSAVRSFSIKCNSEETYSSTFAWKFQDQIQVQQWELLVQQRHYSLQHSTPLSAQSPLPTQPDLSQSRCFILLLSWLLFQASVSVSVFCLPWVSGTVCYAVSPKVERSKAGPGTRIAVASGVLSPSQQTHLTQHPPPTTQP